MPAGAPCSPMPACGCMRAALLLVEQPGPAGLPLGCGAAHPCSLPSLCLRRRLGGRAAPGLPVRLGPGGLLQAAARPGFMDLCAHPAGAPLAARPGGAGRCGGPLSGLFGACARVTVTQLLGKPRSRRALRLCAAADAGAANAAAAPRRLAVCVVSQARGIRLRPPCPNPPPAGVDLPRRHDAGAQVCAGACPGGVDP